MNLNDIYRTISMGTVKFPYRGRELFGQAVPRARGPGARSRRWQKGLAFHPLGHQCVTNVSPMCHWIPLEADPKFETFDAFLRKRQRLGSVQDSLLAAYLFSAVCQYMYGQTRQRMRHGRPL